MGESKTASGNVTNLGPTTTRPPFTEPKPPVKKPPVAPGSTPPTTGGTTPTTKPVPRGTSTTVVPGKVDPKQPGQVNVADYGGKLVTNPSLGLTGDNKATAGTNESMRMEDHLQKMDPTNGLIDKNDPSLKLGTTPKVTATQVDQVKPTQANTYTAQTTEGKVAQNQMTAAQGTVSQNAQVQAAQADMKGLATGTNADGTTNYTGQALNKYASQNMSNIIDTSTVAGKLMAQQLGDGNFVDSKATIAGQLEILQKQFVDENTGEPKIPSWAAGTARNVSKIAAFSGMTGTAAVSAMSQALLEASIPIAQQDAQFFQTLTLKNLDNKQQSIINTANVLSKFDQMNLDNRMTAAVENARAFLQMDMKNLDNQQQAKVINNQSRIQSILEDAKAVNAQRLFTAESKNDMDKFYANLNTSIKQFNSSQTLDASKFNATMEDSRQKFYSEMNYNIAVANAKWRQTVQLQDDQQAHEAATMDVKNMVDISNNQLNHLWDRADSLLDYVWKSSESEKDRNAQLVMAQLAADTKMSDSTMTALGSLAGTFVGSKVGQDLIGSIFKGLF